MGCSPNQHRHCPINTSSDTDWIVNCLVLGPSFGSYPFVDFYLSLVPRYSWLKFPSSLTSSFVTLVILIICRSRPIWLLFDDQRSNKNMSRVEPKNCTAQLKTKVLEWYNHIVITFKSPPHHVTTMPLQSWSFADQDWFDCFSMIREVTKMCLELSQTTAPLNSRQTYLNDTTTLL